MAQLSLSSNPWAGRSSAASLSISSTPWASVALPANQCIRGLPGSVGEVEDPVPPLPLPLALPDGLLAVLLLLEQGEDVLPLPDLLVPASLPC